MIHNLFEILLSQHALGCLLYKLFFAGFVAEGKHFYKIPTRLLGHSPFAVIAEFWPVSILLQITKLIAKMRSVREHKYISMIID